MKCMICEDYSTPVLTVGGTRISLCEKHLQEYDDYMWEFHSNKLCDYKESKLGLEIIKHKAGHGLATISEVYDYLEDIHEAEAEFRVLTQAWINMKAEEHQGNSPSKST